jgi:hypothetical protein
MSSLDLEAGVEPHTKLGTVFRLLDAAFGHFVWAAHFLVVYVGAALACTFGIGVASSGARAGFIAALVIVTAAAAAIVVTHARHRYRQYRDTEDQHFRLSITLGNSAIATVGIVWQLFPILLVPACA